MDIPDFDPRTFATCSEFESTMESILPKKSNYYARGGGPIMLEQATTDTVVAPTLAKSSQGVVSNTPHSETNVQVA